MHAIITKTLRIPIGLLAKVEIARGEQSFTRYCLESLRDKVDRDALTGPPHEEGDPAPTPSEPDGAALHHSGE